MNHVMVDIETLGTGPDSVIMSIGAVKFDLESDAMDDEGFYASISVDSNISVGRRVDESTLIWWMQQPPVARAVFDEPKEALEDALISFADWLQHDKRCIWSNGADFDLPMLVHAYRQFQMDPPWKFWNSRCVRTYKNLPQAAGISWPNADHNALSDAVRQVRMVQEIHQRLSGNVRQA